MIRTISYAFFCSVFFWGCKPSTDQNGGSGEGGESSLASIGAPVTIPSDVYRTIAGKPVRAKLEASLSNAGTNPRNIEMLSDVRFGAGSTGSGSVVFNSYRVIGGNSTNAKLVRTDVIRNVKLSLQVDGRGLYSGTYSSSYRLDSSMPLTISLNCTDASLCPKNKPISFNGISGDENSSAFQKNLQVQVRINEDSGATRGQNIAAINQCIDAVKAETRNGNTCSLKFGSSPSSKAHCDRIESSPRLADLPVGASWPQNYENIKISCINIGVLSQ